MEKQKNIQGNQGEEHCYRAAWKDYTEPTIYLLTMNTRERLPILGTLEGERIILSEIGKKVADEIRKIPTYKDASPIEIYRFVVMPNHIHVLLRVHEQLVHPIGYYIGWFKMQCMEKCSVLDGIPSKEKQPIFGKEYHDRILMRKGQLARMATYIADNPKRLAMICANPDLFRIKQEKRVGKTPCLVMGNIFLADNPQKEVLKCSRKMSQEEIDTRKAECLREAANGTVFVSGAISEGEKQICRALREARYPLIIILTEGFPEADSKQAKYYKPKGVYFEACAAGRLLLVQPDKEILEREDIKERVKTKVGELPHESQRYRFVAMNAVAEDIVER